MSARRRAGGRKAQQAGATWERNIESRNAWYLQQRQAEIEHIATEKRLVAGRIVYTRKAATDFIGWVYTPRGPVPCRFDAKAFSGRWDFSYYKPGGKKRHQYEALERACSAPGISFLLLSCSELRKWPDGTHGYSTWLLPFSALQSIIAEDKWALTADDLDHCARFVDGTDWLPVAMLLWNRRFNAAPTSPLDNRPK